MNHSKYQKELGVAAAYTKRTMEATEGVDHNYITKGTKDCFLFDRW